jgi:colicin import membrane protein
VPQKVERDAEIAIEKAKREKERAREAEEDRKQAEREKAEKDKAEKDKLARAKADAQADKRRKQEEDARLARLREENLQRLMGQVGATGSPNSAGTAARSGGPSASYAGKVRAAIEPKITWIHSTEGNPAAEVLVRAALDGAIVSRNITKSSGDKEWDQAVLDAIDKTGRLPRDDDGRVPSAIIITFRPKS